MKTANPKLGSCIVTIWPKPQSKPLPFWASGRELYLRRLFMQQLIVKTLDCRGNHMSVLLGVE